MMGRAVQRECRETTGMDGVPRVEGKEREIKTIHKSTAIYRQAAAKEAKHRQRAAGEGSRESRRSSSWAVPGDVVLPGGEGLHVRIRRGPDCLIRIDINKTTITMEYQVQGQYTPTP